MERHEKILAPSSLPADSSLDEQSKVASASFVAGLFSWQRKGKRSFDELEDDTESLAANSAKKATNQSSHANERGCATNMSKTDDANVCNTQELVRSPPKQLPTGDVDVFGFRKRKSSQSPQEERHDVRRKLPKTSNAADEVVLSKGDAGEVSLSHISASGTRLTTPANSHPISNAATSSRRPRRFAAPPLLPTQQFISTRKSSAAFYHPPILTDGNSSRILSCSYKDVLQDVSASQLTPGSYNDEGADVDGEEEDGNLPVLECSVLPLVKRQEDEGEPRIGEVVSPASVRNYKLFRKVSFVMACVKGLNMGCDCLMNGNWNECIVKLGGVGGYLYMHKCVCMCVYVFVCVRAQFSHSIFV